MKEPLKYTVKMNLGFFDAGEKTEKATPKKRKEARGEGNVAKSQEASTAVLLLAVFFAFKYFMPNMVKSIMTNMQYSFTMISSIEDIMQTDYIAYYVAYMFGQSILIATPILAVALVIGVVINLVQVGWHPTTKPLKVKLSKINPISGFKRMFSLQSLLNLVKSIAKLAIIIIVIYNVVKDEIEKIPGLLSVSLLDSVIFIGDLIVRVGLNVGFMFLFVAIVDYSYARYKHNKDIKMSKQEVKEEYKQTEGNPEIKGKIRRKMREISMRRMMGNVPKADVIITNPTHFAVALEYDREKGLAPIVSAKGVDFLAKRIKDVAKENGVEIVENVQLARTLYSNVNVGQEIPPDLYQAVAEVLAFVYKLKNKTG